MSATKLKLVVLADDAGERLDVFCARKVADRTRSYFTKLASSNHILADDKVSKPSLKVKEGMRIEIELVSPPPIEALPENIPIEVVYEDKRIVVINKPAGMVSHPAAGSYSGTLINALLYHFKEISSLGDDLIRPGLVHRLDKDTSGLIIIAKDERALAYLQSELKQRRISRRYMALVWGQMEHLKGIIDLPVGRSTKDRKIMAVNLQRGREAMTHWEVKERFGLANLLLLKLETGRTHQIRVHLSHLGHPVAGDPSYGGRSKYIKRFKQKDLQVANSVLEILKRQALHAFRLELSHPDDGRILSFESTLPADMSEAIQFLRSAK